MIICNDMCWSGAIYYVQQHFGGWRKIVKPARKLALAASSWALVTEIREATVNAIVSQSITDDVLAVVSVEFNVTTTNVVVSPICG